MLYKTLSVMTNAMSFITSMIMTMWIFDKLQAPTWLYVLFIMSAVVSVILGVCISFAVYDEMIKSLEKL